MRIFKHLYDFYINASIHVALAASALALISLKELNIPHDRHILNFIFFATITGYNFVKYFGLAKFHHRSLGNWLRIIQVFSLVCFILMCFYAFKLNTSTLIGILIMCVITFFYATPFLPRKIFIDSKYNLRTITGLKVYVIALVWAIVTVVLPVINNGYAIDFDIIIMAFQRYLYVVVLILPFDIRDLRYDSLKLGTIPQKIGIQNTKLLGILLLFMFLLLEFFKDTLSVSQVLSTILISVITGLFIVFSSIDRGRSYSAFWVEGLPILWLALICMLA